MFDIMASKLRDTSQEVLDVVFRQAVRHGIRDLHGFEIGVSHLVEKLFLWESNQLYGEAGTGLYLTTGLFHKILDENPDLKSKHIAFQMRGK